SWDLTMVYWVLICLLFKHEGEKGEADDKVV
nr:hypothetical protein [Tanacetum cinerariifolium]